MDREAFLTGVRERLADVDVIALPDALPETFASGDGRLFDRFAEELGKVGGEARSIHTYEVADVVAELSAGCSSAVVAAGVGTLLGSVEEGLRRAGCEVAEPTRAHAMDADIGITGAVVGVASTGSVLIAMGPDAPRVASLLPPLHLVIVRQEDLVAGFEELFTRMAGLARDHAQTVLVTGPSRTGDIELALVRGVHGPTRVVVLVVEA